MEENKTEPTKNFEAIFEVVMPNETKPRMYKIPVEAGDLVEAMARATDAWEKATEPKDIRIKEVR